MATVIVDQDGTDFTLGGCLEDINGNLVVTIDASPDLDITTIVNQAGYIDGTLVDNGDGTWSFEIDPEFATELCIPINDEPPVDCATACISFLIRQNIADGNYQGSFILDEAPIDITVNGISYGSATFFDVTGAVAGDCVTYSIVLTTTAECTETFDVTFPACDYFDTIEDCTTINLCVTYDPSFTWECLDGVVTVTTNDDGGTVVSEVTEWSEDGNIWNAFATTFEPTSQTGYIRYSVDYDDGCEPIEVIEEFVCTTECENFSEFACTYDDVTDTYTATAIDNFTSIINTDTTLYFPNGAIIGIPYTLGAPISAVGIDSVTFIRTVTFTDSCPDLIMEATCESVDVDCDYSEFELTCETNENTQSITPTFTGDSGGLETDIKQYSVDGASYTPYLGGAIPANLFAVFTWEIKKAGCDPIFLTSACGIPCCDEIDVNIVNTPTINVEGDFCCDDGGGSPAPCPDPIVNDGEIARVGVFTEITACTEGTYFTNDTQLHLQTLGTTLLIGSGGNIINGTDDCVWDSDGVAACGRFNKSAVTVGGTVDFDYSVGHCFTVTESKKYSIGFGSVDNTGVLSVDGVEAINLEQNGGTVAEEDLTHTRWWVVELFLEAGEHHIRVDNRGGTLANGFGFEVYEVDNTTLESYTTIPEIDAVVITNSRNINNLNEAFGELGGLQCGEGVGYWDGCTPKCDCGGAGGGYTYESSLFHNDIFGDGTAGVRISLFYKGAFHSIIVGAANNVLIDTKTYNQAYADAINAAGIIGLSAENPTAADLTANCHSLDDLGDYKVRNLECIRIKFEVGENFMMVFDSDPDQYLNQNLSSSCDGTGACSSYEIYNKCITEYT